MPAVRAKSISRRVAAAVVLAAAAWGAPAWAQSKLEAHYVATLAGIPVGKGNWYLDITNNQFTAAANGQTTGLLRVFTGGQGTVAARGAMSDGRPIPGTYAANILSDKKFNEVRMAISGGIVSEVRAEPPLSPAGDRVPVAETHRRGVFDPMSALLIAASGQGNTVSPEACNRTLPIFDGRGRFDLVLTYKRMEQVKAATGYRGPAVVCSVSYRPIAGHRPSLPTVKYLVRARDMEVWLAPVSGSRILVPFRVFVPTMIGPAVLEATKFVTSGQIERPAVPTIWSQQMGLRLRSLD